MDVTRRVGRPLLFQALGIVLMLNTMVFTHIPSSLLLMALPFAPSSAWAVMLYLAWESWVEMDVSTRQSYLIAVIQSGERTVATGITNLARSVSRSVTPSLAGYVVEHIALATPLFLGGSIKIAYDLMFYSAFRRLKPPEERSPRLPWTRPSRPVEA